METLVEDQAETFPRYTIYRAAAGQELVAGWSNEPLVDFGDQIQMRVLVSPTDEAHPGDVLSVTLGLRQLHPIEHACCLPARGRIMSKSTA